MIRRKTPLPMSTAPRKAQYETLERGAWRIVRIKESIRTDMDYSWLTRQVEEFCSQGHPNIALTFDKESYLFSKLISIMVGCAKVCKKHGGNLAVLEPTAHVLKTLTALNLRDTVIAVYMKDADLPG
jgi:hypothetical protein